MRKMWEERLPCIIESVLKSLVVGKMKDEEFIKTY